MWCFYFTIYLSKPWYGFKLGIAVLDIRYIIYLSFFKKFFSSQKAYSSEAARPRSPYAGG